MTLAERLNKHFIPVSSDLPNRRYDLDWLRVLAFGSLIFFHIGMVYVEHWGFHIKSQYLSDSLENIMLIVEPWRMPLLWFISGVAIRFILVRVSLQRFIVMRSYRLLLPLLFGVLVIVPPQLYYEMTFNGDLDISYWSFYLQFFQLDSPIFENYQAGIWPHIDVNHLWYIRELWLFSLYLLLLLPLLNSSLVTNALDRVAKLNGLLLATVFSLPVLAIQFILGVEGEREAIGFTFLVYGYLIGWHKQIWQTIKQSRYQFLTASIICYALLLIGYHFVYLDENNSKVALFHFPFMLVYGLDRVLWMFTALGFGYKLLNHNSTKLNYLNQAVYPYYIVHQTVIIVCGYELSQFQLGGFIEPLVLILLTFCICAVAFEVIRNVGFLRPLFGLKMKTSTPAWALRLGYITSTILVIPIALEIIL
jgi:hypothetical protein